MFTKKISSAYSKSADFVKSNLTHVKKDEPINQNQYIAVDSQDRFGKVLEYNEDTIGIRNFINDNTNNPLQRFTDYFISLFPILTWIYRYNLTWLYGDLIAGITVGIVAVPQAMSYAKIATLPPEYGLYSSFVGVFIYSFFATSKDVCIGPVAVMSLEVSRTIIHVTEKYPELSNRGPEIAVTLALICGGIAAGIGFLRLGFILEFIPLPAVMGFMTGSAFSIIVGQVPGMFGLAKRINTRDSTYLVFINFWRNISHTSVDVAFGLPALVILFVIKYACDYLTRKVPRLKIVWFYLSVLRNGIIIIVFTAISYACYKEQRANPPISLIKTVPSGLRHVGVPTIDTKIVNALLPELPVSVIVLLLEHISIAKSFGRINNYKIVPDQELIAIGVNNMIGVFFSAYPATGSFSRTALKAKCGVRTPIAGLFTGAVVLLALYALTEAFYWIPNATLCAIIIHAVFDLMVHPRVSWRLWKISPVEGLVFLAAVFITVFSTIEAGIYFSMCASLAFLLLRIAKARGQFLGRIEYYELVDPSVISRNGTLVFDNRLAKQHSHDAASEPEPLNNNKIYGGDEEEIIEQDPRSFDSIFEVEPVTSNHHRHIQHTSLSSSNRDSHKNTHACIKKYKWVPLSLTNLNPDLNVLPPPPGVIVFRPNESFIYPNSSRQVDYVLDEVRRVTRPGIPKAHLKLGDRPWNDGGPRHLDPSKFKKDVRPRLRAIVFDMGASPYIDATSVQNLVDIKNAINRYSGSEDIEYHFVGLISSWSRRALVAAGFGTGVPECHLVDASERNISNLPYRGMTMPDNNDNRNLRASRRDGVTLFSTLEDDECEDEFYSQKNANVDEEVMVAGANDISSSSSSNSVSSRQQNNHILLPIIGTNTPFFHFSMSDLDYHYKNWDNDVDKDDSNDGSSDDSAPRK